MSREYVQIIVKEDGVVIIAPPKISNEIIDKLKSECGIELEVCSVSLCG